MKNIVPGAIYRQIIKNGTPFPIIPLDNFERAIRTPFFSYPFNIREILIVAFSKWIGRVILNSLHNSWQSVHPCMVSVTPH
jgi:hypothetical protein